MGGVRMMDCKVFFRVYLTSAGYYSLLVLVGAHKYSASSVLLSVVLRVKTRNVKLIQRSGSITYLRQSTPGSVREHFNFFTYGRPINVCPVGAVSDGWGVRKPSGRGSVYLNPGRG